MSTIVGVVVWVVYMATLSYALFGAFVVFLARYIGAQISYQQVTVGFLCACVVGEMLVFAFHHAMYHVKGTKYEQLWPKSVVEKIIDILFAYTLPVRWSYRLLLRGFRPELITAISVAVLLVVPFLVGWLFLLELPLLLVLCAYALLCKCLRF